MTAVCAQKIGMGQEIEKEADLFASYFLMPAAALQTKVEMLKAKNNSDDLSIHDVIRLEQYFQVSHQAAVIRLRQDKLLNADAADAMMSEGVRRFAESMGYSTELYKPLPAEKQYMTYGNYIDQAEQVLKRGLVSDGKYEELLLTAFRSDLVYGGNEEGEEVID
jgi:Zn-dependent peptidase ImmA (M78 family)